MLFAETRCKHGATNRKFLRTDTFDAKRTKKETVETIHEIESMQLTTPEKDPTRLRLEYCGEENVSGGQHWSRSSGLMDESVGYIQ